MSNSQTSPDPRMASASRARRGAAAVIAQYIQELTHPVQAGSVAAA